MSSVGILSSSQDQRNNLDSIFLPVNVLRVFSDLNEACGFFVPRVIPEAPDDIKDDTFDCRNLLPYQVKNVCLENHCHMNLKGEFIFISFVSLEFDEFYSPR